MPAAQTLIVAMLVPLCTLYAAWKLMPAAGIVESPVEPDGVRIPRRALRSIDWIGPTIFFAGAVMAENPQVVGDLQARIARLMATMPDPVRQAHAEQMSRKASAPAAGALPRPSAN